MPPGGAAERYVSEADTLQHDFSDESAVSYMYTRADGTVEQAETVEEAQRKCPVLAAMSLEAAGTILDLASAHQQDRQPVDESQPQTSAIEALYAQIKQRQANRAPVPVTARHTPPKTEDAVIATSLQLPQVQSTPEIEAAVLRTEQSAVVLPVVVNPARSADMHVEVAAPPQLVKLEVDMPVTGKLFTEPVGHAVVEAPEPAPASVLIAPAEPDLTAMVLSIEAARQATVAPETDVVFDNAETATDKHAKHPVKPDIKRDFREIPLANVHNERGLSLPDLIVPAEELRTPSEMLAQLQTEARLAPLSDGTPYEAPAPARLPELLAEPDDAAQFEAAIVTAEIVALASQSEEGTSAVQAYYESINRLPPLPPPSAPQVNESIGASDVLPVMVSSIDENNSHTGLETDLLLACPNVDQTVLSVTDGIRHATPDTLAITRKIIGTIQERVRCVEDHIMDVYAGADVIVASEAELIQECTKLLDTLRITYTEQEVRRYARYLIIESRMTALHTGLQASQKAVYVDNGMHERKFFDTTSLWRQHLQTAVHHAGNFSLHMFQGCLGRFALTGLAAA